MQRYFFVSRTAAAVAVHTGPVTYMDFSMYRYTYIITYNYIVSSQVVSTYVLYFQKKNLNSKLSFCMRIIVIVLLILIQDRMMIDFRVYNCYYILINTF